MINKPNDWIATVLFQPDATLEDLYVHNITPDNTKIENRDYYKTIPQVIEKFTDENGKFNEAKFNMYYDDNLKVYNTFANLDFEKVILESKEFDVEDWTAVGKNVTPISTVISFTNENFHTVGISSLGLSNSSSWSNEEIAQTQKVFDPKTNTFLDWTPNDKGGLFKGLTMEPLVYATYLEDGFHEVNGKQVSHQKGEWMLNEDGLPFTMLAYDEEQYGRNPVTYTDVLTKEGTTLNKYDFFDSDGLEKSISGTIAKTMFNVLPYFIPYVGTTLGYISAGATLAQLLPTIGKSINGIFFGNDNELGKNLTWLENHARKFSSDVSQASKERLATFENLGNLIGGVSTQLFQQRAIGSIPKLFTKNPNLVNQKVGQNLALAYMAGTSAQETYKAFKEAGATDRTAGIGMLASIAGLYILMNQEYFRKFLFNGSFLDDTIVKGPAFNVAKETNKEMFGELEKKPAKTVFEKFLRKFSDKYSSLTEKLNTSGVSFWDAAKSEGLEEMAEEFTTDMIKAGTLAVNALGWNTTEDGKTLNFGFSGQDILQRYAMSFVGGAIGGPIFELHNRWDKVLFNKINDVTPKTDQQELVYLIQQNKDAEIKQVYKKWRDKGLLGNTNLSATEYKTVKNSDGTEERVYLSAKPGESQNDAVYNMLVQQVDYIKSVLRSEGMMLTEDDLKQVFNKEGKLIDDPFVTKLINSGINTRLLKSWTALSTDIFNIKTKLDAALEQAYTGAATEIEKKNVEENLKNNQEIVNLQDELKALREKRDSILKTEGLADYFGEAMFVLDKNTHSNFLNISLESFSKWKYGASLSSFSAEKQDEIKSEYQEYVKNEGLSGLYTAYDLYKQFQEKHKTKLIDINDKLKNIGVNADYNEDDSFAKLALEAVWMGQTLNALRAIPDPNEEQIKTIAELEAKQEKLNEKLDNIGIQNIELQTLQALNGTPFLRADLTQLDELYYNFYKNSPVLNPDGRLSEEEIAANVSKISALDKMQAIIDKSAETLQKYYEKLKSTGTVDTYNNELDFLYSQVGKLGTQSNPESKLAALRDEIIENDEFHTKNQYEDFMWEAIDETQIMSNDNTKLLKLVNTFLNTLGKNNDVAMKTYRQIIDLIENDSYYNILPDNKKEPFKQAVLNALLPSVNGKNVVEHMEMMNQLKREVVANPFIDFLKEFTLGVKGSNNTIIDLIEMEERTLKNKESVRDYVIENTNSAYELEEGKKLTELAYALVMGGGNGLNKHINKFRKAKGLDEYAELEENPAKILLKGAEQILDKINILQTWSTLNQNQRLREQKDITKNVVYKQVQSLLDETLIKALNKLGINLPNKWNPIANKYGITLSEISDSDFSNLESAKIELETEIHNFFFTEYLETGKQVELAKALVDVFGKDLHRCQTSVFTSDKELKLTNYDKLVYLSTIIASNSQKFYTKYKQLTMSSSASFNFAPIYSQEYAVRVGYAQFLEPDFFTVILTEIQSAAKESNDEYIKNKSIFDRIYVILGGAGTGKTTAVDFLLSLMISDSTEGVISVGATNSQASDLKKIIGGTQTLTKDELLNKIKNNVAFKYVLNETTQHVELEQIIEPSDVSLWRDDVKNRVLVVDEITFYDEQELSLLNAYAKKHNAIIIGSGDNKQNGKKLSFSVKNSNGRNVTTSHMSGIEDGIFIAAPTLIASMRAGNIASLNNANNLESGLRHAIKTAIEADNDPSVARKAVENWLKENKGLVLEYQEDTESKDIAGEKIVNTINEAKEYISAFKQLTEDPMKNVAVIASNPSKYSGLGVEVIGVDNVQGGEFDYCVIDVDWNPRGTQTVFDILKNVYTLTQRSRKGTVIVDQNLTSLLKVVNTETTNGATIISIRPEEIEAYKEFRFQGLLNVPEDFDFQTRRESVFNKPIVPPPAAPPTTPPPAVPPAIPPTTPPLAPKPATPPPSAPPPAPASAPAPKPMTPPPAPPQSNSPDTLKTGKQHTDFMRGQYIDFLNDYVKSNYTKLKSLNIFAKTTEEDLKLALLSLSDYLWNTNFWTASSNILSNKWQEIQPYFIGLELVSKFREGMEFILEPDKVLYVALNKGSIKLPIGKTNVSVAVPTKLINLKGKRRFNGGKTFEHTPQHVPISHLSTVFGIKFQPKLNYIFMGSNTAGYNYQQTNKATFDFVVENNGKSFIPILFDLSATNSEFKSFLSPSSTLQTYVDYEKPGELLGVQAISYELNDIVRFIHTQDNKNVSNEKLNEMFNIIFGTTVPKNQDGIVDVQVMPFHRGRLFALDVLLQYFNSNSNLYNDFVVNELLSNLTKFKDWRFSKMSENNNVETDVYLLHWNKNQLELIQESSNTVVETFDIIADLENSSDFLDKSKIRDVLNKIVTKYNFNQFTFVETYNKQKYVISNINKILKRLFPVHDQMYDYIPMLDDNLRNTSQWQYGYYLNDIAQDKSLLWSPNLYNKDNYLVDLGEIQSISNVIFSLEYETGQVDAENNSKLAEYKSIIEQTLHEIKSEVDDSVYMRIQNEFYSIDLNEFDDTDKFFDRLKDILYDAIDSNYVYSPSLDTDGQVQLDKEWDPILGRYEYRKNKQNIDILVDEEIPRKFQFFVLYLQNNSKKYIVVTDTNEYSVSEQTWQSFIELMDLVEETEDLSKIDTMGNYLIETFFENPNPDVISKFMSEEWSQEIKNKLEQYLINRLKENEC